MSHRSCVFKTCSTQHAYGRTCGAHPAATSAGAYLLHDGDGAHGAVARDDVRDGDELPVPLLLQFRVPHCEDNWVVAAGVRCVEWWVVCGSRPLTQTDATNATCGRCTVPLWQIQRTAAVHSAKISGLQSNTSISHKHSSGSARSCLLFVLRSKGQRLGNRR